MKRWGGEKDRKGKEEVGVGDSPEESTENNSRNIKEVFFKHQQCTSQKKHNDTHCAIAMTTVMPLVLF